MPLLRLQTNIVLEKSKQTQLATELSLLVAELLGKSSDFVQVILEDGQTIVFGGTEDSSVFVELRSLGFGTTSLSAIANELTRVVAKRLGVEPKRVFLNFLDLPRTHWGWNGKTFE